jgi:hypothetical protein
MHRITRTPLAALAVAALGQSGPAAAAEKPLTVVELFTSQGCSSCPAADRLLGVLAKRDDLLPLSVHVDYWDYIGWKDAFAKPANGNRQRGYAARFQLKYVYTPQMVCDGAYQAVGSNESEIKGLIEKASADTHVAVELKRTGNSGNTLSYHNVVRKMAPVALWRGEAKTIQIALPQGKDGGEACAVLIQMQDSRRIVGAARLPVSGS